MTAADDLKDKILDLANVYDDITTKDFQLSQQDQATETLNSDGVVKSHILNYPHRRYYLDLKKNNRGYFLRVTMLSSSARIKLAIPAEGMRKLYSSICSMLKAWWIPTPERTNAGTFQIVFLDSNRCILEMSLPPSRAFRIDNRTLYFDPVANRHGVFLRISQVWASSRSAITIPGRSMDKFREIINELADHISAARVGSIPMSEHLLLRLTTRRTDPMKKRLSASSRLKTSMVKMETPTTRCGREYCNHVLTCDFSTLYIPFSNCVFSTLTQPPVLYEKTKETIFISNFYCFLVSSGSVFYIQTDFTK